MRCGSRPRRRSERLRDALRDGQHPGQRRAGQFRRSSGSKVCRRDRTPRSGTAANEVQTNFERSSGTNGAYTFTMRPNVQVNLREEAVVQARQTIERRVNELGVAEPSIAQQGTRPDSGAAARRDRRRPREGDHRIARPAGAEDRRAGAVGDERRAADERPAARRHGNPAGRRRRRRRGHGVLPGASVPRRSPAAICGARVRRSTRTTARRSASRSTPKAARSSARSPARTSGGSSRSSSTAACSRRRRIEGRITTDGRITRQLHAGGSAEPLADSAIGRAAGDADLSRGADDRAERSAPIRSAPA